MAVGMWRTLPGVITAAYRAAVVCFETFSSNFVCISSLGYKAIDIADDMTSFPFVLKLMREGVLTDSAPAHVDFFLAVGLAFPRERRACFAPRRRG